MSLLWPVIEPRESRAVAPDPAPARPARDAGGRPPDLRGAAGLPARPRARGERVARDQPHRRLPDRRDAGVPDRHRGAARSTGQEYEEIDLFSMSTYVNAMSLPAVAVPVGRTPDGLPIGVQVIGRRYREMEVLAVARGARAGARRLDQAGARRRPPRRSPASPADQPRRLPRISWNHDRGCLHHVLEPDHQAVEPATLRTASSTPGMKDSREIESWRTVSVWPRPPKITSWCATRPGSRTLWIGGVRAPAGLRDQLRRALRGARRRVELRVVVQLDDLAVGHVGSDQLRRLHHQHGADREVGRDQAVARATARPPPAAPRPAPASSPVVPTTTWVSCSRHRRVFSNTVDGHREVDDHVRARLRRAPARATCRAPGRRGPPAPCRRRPRPRRRPSAPMRPAAPETATRITARRRR